MTGSRRRREEEARGAAALRPRRVHVHHRQRRERRKCVMMRTSHAPRTNKNVQLFDTIDRASVSINHGVFPECFQIWKDNTWRYHSGPHAGVRFRLLLQFPTVSIDDYMQNLYSVLCSCVKGGVWTQQAHMQQRSVQTSSARAHMRVHYTAV